MTPIESKIHELLTRIRTSDITVSEVFNYSEDLNNFASYILSDKFDKNNVDVVNAYDSLLRICNIMYNHTDRSVLPIEDGVYDLLLEKYKTINPYFQVGSENVVFKDEPTSKYNLNHTKTEALYFMNPDEYDMRIYNGFYSEELYKVDNSMSIKDVQSTTLTFFGDVTKRQHNTQHNHPQLVGTLDKCKFVLMSQTIERGVENDSNVAVLERDFFADHIAKGILDPRREITMVLELKYDGVSVEADCTNVVESARTRGDTGIGQAADITPILEGYPFPHSKFYGSPDEEPLGVKFEAIMTHNDLARFNMAKGYNYSNCRTAIIGLMGGSDAAKYRDYITLIPLAMDTDQFEEVSRGFDYINREQEICFLNKYFATKGHPLQYAVIKGDYKRCLFLIKKFVEEAEVARNFLDFMYDGVVVSYMDRDIREALGRVNFINKYSMAIKFNPLRRQTTFRGYTYTVGQNGIITPMIHYNPVEFYGTIHNKSTGSSYERFQNLGLRIGDIITVEYTNDVMPYVTKPDCVQNLENRNPVCEFITHCPECGTKLILSDSRKTMKCPNPSCHGRLIARMTNMMQKLNLKDFGEERMMAIGKEHLCDVINMTYDELVEPLGQVNAEKFVDRMNHLKTDPIYDYQLMGALGFSGIATKKWQLILKHYTISELFLLWINSSIYVLDHIKGIGQSITDIIEQEWEYFLDDINYIVNMPNLIVSKYETEVVKKSVRCTGFRNGDLMSRLNILGFDADDNGSVTKSTDILLVPYEGYVSGKTKKAGPNTIIIDVDSFVNNVDKYL